MNKNYASISERVKAAFIDSLVLVAMMYASSDFLTMFDEVPKYLRWSLLVFVFILYDPLLTHFFGSTLGQSFIKIGVRTDNLQLKKISFPFAVIRFLFKATLGWISLLTIAGNKKSKSIHDLVANSVVIKVEDDK